MALAVMVCCMAMSASVPAAAKAGNSFWLLGTASAKAGSRLHMYYGKDAVTLKGNVRKARSVSRLKDAEPEQIRASFKIHGSCKVFFEEEDGSVTQGRYKDWIRYGGGGDYKEGDSMWFITVRIRIKNNKITKIMFLT